jgi:hypothetical protein
MPRFPTIRLSRAAGLWATLALVGCGQAPPPPTAEPLSAEDFRRELVNLPLCGTPQTGPLAGKAMCTVHFADGTAVLAGNGMVARIAWEADGRAICRRDISEAASARLCVTYERLSNGRFRNSDGVEFCLGPCPQVLPR